MRSMRAVAGPNVPLITHGHTNTDPGREEVAVAMRTSSSAAAAEVHVARRLCGPHRGTLQSLETGALSYQSARMMVDICEGLDDEQILLVEARVLPGASRRDTSQLRRSARHVVAHLARGEFQASSNAARCARRVTVEPHGDGLATFSALLPVADAHPITIRIGRIDRCVVLPLSSICRLHSDSRTTQARFPATAQSPLMWQGKSRARRSGFGG